jgi:hypothetical protein
VLGFSALSTKLLRIAGSVVLQSQAIRSTLFASRKEIISGQKERAQRPQFEHLTVLEEFRPDSQIVGNHPQLQLYFVVRNRATYADSFAIVWLLMPKSRSFGL